jgi:23S rRNA pseudouridine1911/1915/1917 synthase
MSGPVRLEGPVDGERADVFLARALPELTRSAAQRLLEQGAVTRADGRPLKKNEKLTPSDVLVAALPEAEESELLPENIPLDVRYEDDDVIVVNKPVGMVVHPAAGHESGTLVNALLYHCGTSLSGIGGEKRPGIVHRIDKDTSGLIIAAKNDRAHASLSAQLKDHSMYRVYAAVAIGGFSDEEGTVDAPIGRSRTDRKKMAVDRQNGRSAVTHWKVEERFSGYTYLTCQLETGRTHQIRVHLSSIGHPLLGDPVYGGVRKAWSDLQGQCLHAKALTFTHPATGERLTVTAPLPDWFDKVLTKLRTMG